MKDRAGDVAREFGQFLVALVLRAGPELLRLVLRQCRLRDDAARDTQRVGRHLPVFGCAQVVGGDRRRVFEVGALDADRAAAGRVEVAHAGRDGAEAVQRLTERVQAQRLHVVFEVRMHHLRAAAREGAELRRRHAHRPAARERVLQCDAGLAPP